MTGIKKESVCVRESMRRKMKRRSVGVGDKGEMKGQRKKIGNS